MLNGHDLLNNKNYFELDNSKRRKTCHVSDQKLIQLPSMNFDLSDNTDILNKELDNRSPYINHKINGIKKRNFNKIDTPLEFISKIGKPGKEVNIFYSKYSELPSNIPKIFN
jgi:hypothetical protein